MLLGESLDAAVAALDGAVAARASATVQALRAPSREERARAIAAIAADVARAVEGMRVVL
jgi:hypothetical protein